jgi:hypothetical protein
MRQIINSFWAALRFHGYKPQPLSFLSATRWINQFDKKDRRLAEQLLDSVIYLSESDTRDILLNQNAVLMKRLKDAGLPPKRLIYVSVHEAGSSSPVMLNLLRDVAQLEKLGCRLVDGRDTLGLVKAMNEVGEGALIYVDDFVGTGTQFCTERDFIAKNFVGTFSEFIIAPSICEEAFEKMDERGIQAFAGHKHVKTERPLHAECTVFDEEQRLRMAAICRGIDKFGLGYKGIATMVVLYRNAPNTVPVILRGNVNQKPYFGIFPRTIDLPLPNMELP